MKLEKQARDLVTESVEPPTPSEFSFAVVPGGYYAINAREFSDGFLVCKAIQCGSSHFKGVVYEKTESMDLDEMCFVETKQISRYDLDIVITNLLSARSVRSFVIVDSVEIEELVLSTIEDC